MSVDAAKGLPGVLFALLVVRGGGDPDLYVLLHQSLRDLPRDGSPLNLTMTGCMSWPTWPTLPVGRTCDIEAVMPERDPAGRDSAERDDYTRAYLAEHTAFCDRLDELVIDPEFVQIVAVSLRRHLTTIEAIATVT